MSKYRFILDSGHGGISPQGEYMTKGKRSPIWISGKQLFEGVSNRQFVRNILKKGREKGLIVEDLFSHIPEYKNWQDIPLHTRVKAINRLYKEDKSIRVISIHSNAGGGSGFEVFTSIGYDESDKLAKQYYKAIKKTLPTIPYRKAKNKDVDKEAEFYLLKHSQAPMILTENLFMDTWEDCKKLFKTSWRRKIVDAHVLMMCKY